ncbi:hypothetical protein [Saccharothrix xinjiangensis]|uniref:Zinc finger protein n=1 Tax=Saccharothrix xinjiangensis TaxID=204798 RepID=A0ABV9XVK3_9PSEU
MAKPVAHIGTRSAWDGTVRTLCGELFDSSSARVWLPRLSGYARCTACLARRAR